MLFYNYTSLNMKASSHNFDSVYENVTFKMTLKPMYQC